ncbi:hypothetical protein FAUST_10728 [Fusarium austroamericanum]|uniref:(S)-ureidoglycine aminohydrolase cupin domain-containing protein n=1 Tax=Fusarium austroamericanum TaxID=282268 RepID=A0AAN5Z097_FUSAU|nr:hypothetical protein FAUST_10728 [Fusarium austroamericanum]
MTNSQNSEAPAIKVIGDVPSLPLIVRDGPGAFTDLVSSDPSSAAPIVCGVWDADDVENGDEIWPAEYDEMKYVISGEAEWEDVRTGQRTIATAGSMVWFPKGSQTRLIRSRGLKTIYIEQTYREAVPDAQLKQS